ncbi:hypothetical protein [Aeromicrobium terrae]|uniref:DUF3558 domain-containing protein n=1 Tax=Aeromicrobium terrae TaxID=2498846 RepID=A0A5C8NIF5_9ACTN|nr:hypothetical protein [Aeromicrobium terrae]TXL60777.1 hypothetical protein FHP06_10155 [Aeromicrobium terrae]
MPRTRALVVAVMLCGLAAGCGGGSDGSPSDRDDRSSSVAPADASSTPKGDASGKKSPDSSGSSAKGPGRDLADLCTSIPIARLAATKVSGKVVVSTVSPRDTPSSSIICSYGSKDFEKRITAQDDRAVQFSLVYETYPPGTCKATLDTMKRAGNNVDGDHYVLTLGAVGLCRGTASLAVAMTAMEPPSGSDVDLMRKMLAAAEPRIDDLAERAKLDGGSS